MIYTLNFWQLSPASTIGDWTDDCKRKIENCGDDEFNWDVRVRRGQKKDRTGRYWLAIALCGALLWLTPLSAQEADSSSAALPDSAAVVRDTLKVLTPPPGSGIEGPIKYWAEQITFSLNDQTTHLAGNSKIQYLDITLTAARIDIDWQRNSLTAYGVQDSTDSLGQPVYKGLPVLKEKGEAPISGIELQYDFRHNRGKVRTGRTNMAPGYYRGEDIRKVGKETLFIEDGYFTTCDLEDHPHFYFRSAKMRVRLKKQAVARPVTLYIADVPVFAVPFAIFSLRRGRRSGIILPTFGENSQGGRYLENFGYYWAPNDYFDATLRATFYEKTGFLYNGDMQYRKRYAFNGSVSGNYSPKDIRTGAKSERWRLNFNHFQKIGQTFTINANGSFVSDKSFYRDYSSDYNLRTNQTIRTTATAKKTFPGSRTLSMNFTREENLQTERIDYTFPDLSYSQPARSLFTRKAGGQKQWYHNLRYSYNSKILARGSRIPVTDNASGQITGFDRTYNSGWKHDIVPSYSFKALKYFSFSPSLSLEELWVPEYLEYAYSDSLDRVVVADTVKEFRARHLARGMGMSVRTTLYGLFELPFSPLKVIRHKMDPSIGFSYQPDYSDEVYGYYQTFKNAAGREVRGDRFANNTFAGTPQGEQRNMNISVSNLFQGKIIRGEEEKKIDLFRMTVSTSHNFALDSLRWSNLRTSLQAKPHPKLNFNFNAQHTFYKPRANGRGRRDEFVWSDGFALPSLLNWDVNMSYSLSLRPPEKKSPNAPAPGDVPPDTLDDDILDANRISDENPSGSLLVTDRQLEEFEGLNVPWNLSMNFNFRYNDNQGDISRTFSTNLNAGVRLTKNWNVTYRANLNLRDREIVDQRFHVERDLHCWQLSFDWSPNPNFTFYRLEIRVKESLLRDLKLTKTANGNRPF